MLFQLENFNATLRSTNCNSSVESLSYDSINTSVTSYKYDSRVTLAELSETYMTSIEKANRQYMTTLEKVKNEFTQSLYMTIKMDQLFGKCTNATVETFASNDSDDALSAPCVMPGCLARVQRARRHLVDIHTVWL